MLHLAVIRLALLPHELLLLCTPDHTQGLLQRVSIIPLIPLILLILLGRDIPLFVAVLIVDIEDDADELLPELPPVLSLKLRLFTLLPVLAV